MPPVEPSLLGSSIFLYASEADAREGANWGGSGALVGLPSQANPSRVHLYAVSNDHVVDACPVVRLVGRDGEPYVLPGTAADWEPHPDGDDVAVRPLGAVPEREYWYIPGEWLLSRDDLDPEDRPLQISPGDDCLMVGRYINQDHRQFDRPVVRFGNLAMLPEFVHQDERSFDQESFLVEMRSHSGFSGSPVYVYYEQSGWRYLPPLPDLPQPDEFEDPVERLAAIDALLVAVKARPEGRDLSLIMGRRWLLGIEWGHLPVWDDVYKDGQKFARMRVSTGMAGVVPAWKITDLLNGRVMAQARDKTERQLAETNEGAAILDTSKPAEFAAFEDLTRKLVQVPKRELDEKRENPS